MRYIPVIILLLITVLARGFVRGTDEAPAVPALTPFEIEQMPAPGIADTSCNRITGNVQALGRRSASSPGLSAARSNCP